MGEQNISYVQIGIEIKILCKNKFVSCLWVVCCPCPPFSVPWLHLSASEEGLLEKEVHVRKGRYGWIISPKIFIAYD